MPIGIHCKIQQSDHNSLDERSKQKVLGAKLNQRDYLRASLKIRLARAAGY